MTPSDPLFCFPPSPRISLAVTGQDARFPVRAIYCVGRNYREHAREMGAPTDEAPCFFMKPAHALLADSSRIPYPPFTQDFQHEVELVVALGSGGRRIAPQEAVQAIFGYAIGLDLTRRDLQAQLKKRGQPWELSKSFTGSAACSALVPAGVGRFVDSPRTIRLVVNGTLRQEGRTDEMIWPIATLISELSRYEELAAGDLLFTGTPAGVGPLAAGDRGTAEVVGECHLDFEVVTGPA
jgi:fumarylpyruvate hydrolase